MSECGQTTWSNRNLNHDAIVRWLITTSKHLVGGVDDIVKILKNICICLGAEPDSRRRQKRIGALEASDTTHQRLPAPTQGKKNKI